jgi:hypothetical protein
MIPNDAYLLDFSLFLRTATMLVFASRDWLVYDPVDKNGLCMMLIQDSRTPSVSG